MYELTPEEIKIVEGAASTPQQKTWLQRQIVMTKRQVDALVYELYELTPDEIKIVEGTAEGHSGHPRYKQPLLPRRAPTEV